MNINNIHAIILAANALDYSLMTIEEMHALCMKKKKIKGKASIIKFQNLIIIVFKTV